MEEGRREGGGEAEGRTNVGVRELEGRKLGGGRREGGDIGDIGGSRDEEGGKGWRVKNGGGREAWRDEER